MQGTQHVKPLTWQGDQQNVMLRRLITTLVAYWPRFALCIVISLAVASLYIRYTVPLYNIRAKILIQDDKNGPGYESLVFKELGTASNAKGADNEIEILKGRSIMAKVVKDMQLNVHYYTKGRLQTTEVYEDKPFNFVLLPAGVPVRQNFSCYLKRTPAGFELHNLAHTWSGRWNDTLILSVGKVILIKASGFPIWQKDDEYLITVLSDAKATAQYTSLISFSIPNKQVNAINLTLKESIPERGVQVLDKFISAYLRANVDDKDRIADSTIAFIDQRLDLVGKQLSGVEQQIEDFKKLNKLTDIVQEASLLVNNNNTINVQVKQQEVQLSVIDFLGQYLHNNRNNDQVVPSSLIVDDPAFSSLIQRYNDLQLNREHLLMSSTENNPLVRSLDGQLENIRTEMINSLPAAKRNINAGVQELKKQTGDLDQEIKSVPAKQRIYLEYSRQQAIKQELYLFLLKKREEMAISKSSTLSDVRIIDPASSDDFPYSPNRPQVFLTAIFVGLFIPGLSIYLQSLLNNRVSRKTDIVNNTKAPVIGEIGHNDDNRSMLVQTGNLNALSEQFRMLRTNVQFLLAGKSEKVILLTSGISGEGKSFVALNLANTFAISDKKVLLMELDLRKPQVEKLLGLPASAGFSDYATGQANLNDIILPSGLDPNLFVLLAGHVHPKPAELIMLPLIEQMFQTLRQQFDYIIIDTAPVGLVTDAQLLSSFSDAALFIVRQGYTFKQQLALLEDIYLSNRMPLFGIVVNDIKPPVWHPYRDGYHYGNYDSEYFNKKNKWRFKKLFN